MELQKAVCTAACQCCGLVPLVVANRVNLFNKNKQFFHLPKDYLAYEIRQNETKLQFLFR